MTFKGEYSDDELYTTWVSCNRNATRAGQKLGLTQQAISAHVNKKHFNERWEAEFGSQAIAIKRGILIDAVKELPAMLQVLYDVAHDVDQKGVARVQAVRTYLEAIAVVGQRTENKIPEKDMTFIEAKAILINDVEQNPEVLVRNALEANVIDAHESRTRRK